MKLISMTDFVLEYIPESETDDTKLLDQVFNYASFLKQPLKLEMFVPCDEKGTILKAPTDKEIEKFKGLEFGNFNLNYTIIYDYLEAKEKVLFEFEINTLLDDKTKRLTSPNGVFNVAWYNDEIGWYLSNVVNKMIVEDLIPYEIQLTPTAIKQIGL